MTTKANSYPAKHLRRDFFRKMLLTKEANLEYWQTSKMKLFTIIVKLWNPISIYEKTSTSDVWQGFEYAFELASKCKLMMLHF